MGCLRELYLWRAADEELGVGKSFYCSWYTFIQIFVLCKKLQSILSFFFFFLNKKERVVPSILGNHRTFTKYSVKAKNHQNTAGIRKPV
jgi:hypothetical protein